MSGRTIAHQLDLFGVAFSGGGIRSGTVSLGILQALARASVDHTPRLTADGWSALASCKPWRA